MIRHRVVCAVIAGAIVMAAPPARALVVFDPENYAQNVLQAARTLEQINNQIQALQNQIRMLENMARNLERMEHSSMASISNALRQINGLMHRADGIAFRMTATDQEFSRLYPMQYADAITSNALAIDARNRWEASMSGLRQTMLVQSQVVENVEADTDELSLLVNESQAAVGNLQATQATNQLLALSTKQQLQTQNLLAAQYRAEAMERARAAEDEEAARAQFKRFLGTGPAYTK